MVKSTEGAFSFHDLMAMELEVFYDVIKELNIMESAERFESKRIENHNKVRGK